MTLNIAIELPKPKLLFITKIISKLSLQSYPPSVANTMLGICYTFVAFCCSAHGCCGVKCGVACCASQHTAISTLTVGTREVGHLSDLGGGQSSMQAGKFWKAKCDITLRLV